jgi:hypothetical protein
MSAFTDLASAFGMAKSAALAATVFGAFAGLDRSIRTERKKEVSDFLTRSGDIDAPNTGQVVLTLFEAVFGEHHWTWKSLRRSVIATFLILTFVFVVTQVEFHSLNVFDVLFNAVGGSLSEKIYKLTFMASCSVVADYLSLWKGRIILNCLEAHGRPLVQALLIITDIILSAVIYECTVVAALLVDLLARHSSLQGFFEFVWQLNIMSFLSFRMFFAGPEGYGWFFMVAGTTHLLLIWGFISTLFTSAWAISVGLSSMIVRAVLKAEVLVKFTNWLFDTDNKPVVAIGYVVAAITFVVSAALQAL